MADNELVQIIRGDTKELLQELELYRPKEGAPVQSIKEFEFDEQWV